MAMTGLQIFKLLPKTNCKECGLPTCLAFAMAIAQKKAKLDDCPYASDDAKTSLAEASAPPVQLVKFGTADNEVSVGQETVLFRHDEKFHNPAVVAVSVSDSLGAEALKDRIKKINDLRFERVGTQMQVNAIAVINDSGSAESFAAAAEEVKQSSSLAMILATEKPEAAAAAAAKVADRVPLLAFATAQNAEAFAETAKKHNCPVVAKADSADALAELTEKLKAAGAENIVLSLATGSLKDQLYGLSQMRAIALKKTFRPLGYPIISFATDGSPEKQATAAISLVCKYASIVVIETMEPYAILPILTTIMNIYTDPQKPVQVEAKVYAISEVTEDSPLIFTTNFSLTYYTVESDVEASRVPCYILVVDTEGTSVLTAYSGDKLNEKTVADALEKHGLADMVKHRKLIIPGYVAVMSGKLEEASNWEIVVGPRESSMLPKFLQEVV